MSLLKQDNNKKGRINELFSKPELEFDADNNKEFKVKAIKNSVVYANESEEYLSNLYYLVSWKGYLEQKSTWKPPSTVIYLWKTISTFYKNHPEKSTATSPSFNYTPPMAKPSVKPVMPSAKQKQSRLISSTK